MLKCFHGRASGLSRRGDHKECFGARLQGDTARDHWSRNHEHRDAEENDDPHHHLSVEGQVSQNRTGIAAVVGYPVVTSSTESNDQQLSAHGRFAKIYSPGAVLELQTQDNVNFLRHLAGTTDGSSGSPVFAVPSFDVVGIHNCCTAAGSPPPAALPCASIFAAPARRNLAVALPHVFADPQLAKVFLVP